MFSCSECPKTFATQSSLVRHSQNHTKDVQHVCSECDVVFYRKDLLTRHLKRLHSSEDGAASAPGRGSRVRKRCHTACTSCRDSKLRCNGQRPCARCKASDKLCQYDIVSSRVSDSRSLVPRYGEAGEEEAAEPVHSPMSPTYIRGGLPAVENSEGLRPRQLVSATDSSSMPESHPDVQRPSTTPISNHPTELEDMCFPDLVPWPWMHENLLLSNEPISSILDPTTISTDFNLHPSMFEVTGSNEPQVLGYQFPSNQNSSPRGASSPQGRQPHGTIVLVASNPSAPSNNLSSYNPQHTVLQSEEITAEATTTPRQREKKGSSTRQQFVEELVSAASSVTAPNSSRSDRCRFFSSASTQVSAIFGIRPMQTSSPSTLLQHFFDLYMENFHPLWPLLSRQNLDVEDLHPLLYLSLTTLGAMYGCTAAREFGVLLHDHVRKLLVGPLDMGMSSDDELLALAQARLLTQVTALYFGQPKAFTYAQYLGALLVAQARKMCLYSAVYYRSRMKQFNALKDTGSDTERLSMWLGIESHRRLAFGIFRGDTFASVLLNAKPLITLDEVDIELPTCDAVWIGNKMDVRVALEMIDHDRTPGRHLLASDLYHILMDRTEQLPLLDPLGHELLLFGLQIHVWRFARDPQRFERLTGRDIDEDSDVEEDEDPARGRSAGPTSQTRWSDVASSETGSLDILSRHMSDYSSERLRLLAALKKWEGALTAVKQFSRTKEDRFYILSSLILFHLGHMRLNSPLEDIHQIQHGLADRRPLCTKLVSRVRRWAGSRKARTSVERVCSVWSLITQESAGKDPRHGQSKFNLLAFLAWHHGAATLWAYIVAGDGRSETYASLPAPFNTSFIRASSSSTSMSPQQADKIKQNKKEMGLSEILQSFIDLFGRVSQGQWGSFAEAARLHSNLEFPPQEAHI